MGAVRGAEGHVRADRPAEPVPGEGEGALHAADGGQPGRLRGGAERPGDAGEHVRAVPGHEPARGDREHREVGEQPAQEGAGGRAAVQLARAAHRARPDRLLAAQPDDEGLLLLLEPVAADGQLVQEPRELAQRRVGAAGRAQAGGHGGDLQQDDDPGDALLPRQRPAADPEHRRDHEEEGGGLQPVRAAGRLAAQEGHEGPPLGADHRPRRRASW